MVGGSTKIEGKLDIGSDALCARLRANQAQIGSGTFGTAKIAGEAVIDDLTASEVKAGHVKACEVHTKGNLVVEGHIHNESMAKYWENHNNNQKGSTHKVFTNRVNGFVPAPAGEVGHYTFLTSHGEWRSFGEYLELQIEQGKIVDSISDRETRWVWFEDELTIPYQGTYEIHLTNIKHISLNGEIVSKSENLGSTKFLLRLNKRDVIALQGTANAGILYIRRLD